MRRVYSLSLPVIGELSLQHGLAAVDALFVAKLGLLSLNAVGVTSMFSVILLSILNALGVTVTVFLSRATTHATSEKTPSHARSLVWHGLVMGGSVGLTVAILCLLFATPLLHLAGAQGELQRTAMPYFFLVLSSTPVLALQTMLAACLRASGDTQTPLKVGLQMNLVHVALDALFIFGFDMGVAGAGVAYLLVQLFTLGLYLRRAAHHLPTRRDLKLSRPILARMMRFAVPAVIERLFKRGGQAVYLSFVVRMGTEPYAANNIANVLSLFTSLLGDGLATGVSIAMGQAIGDETSDRQTLQARLTEIRRWGFLGAAVSMTLTTLLLWCLSPWISLWFTDEPHVIQLITLVLGIYIFCQPFFAANLIDCAAIQAGGNSTYTMWVTILGVWGVRLVFIPILIFGFHLGLSGVWMCIGLDHMTRAYLYRRYRLKRDILYVP
ncbi:MATE family efflux transporter [Tumebacillus sp. ITR2]|uniref:Probable multidrug resistance protein NorM n=1 Tax=Tumebacillus amylolyticus TaxID=2801339 RepID=A0ABS1J4N5_9BACL|nr:MATE family efflux transporter [Tumebacillus amylolyticus]MBL0385244.1 MATE family efflux transporter [Tumebacillus amylolyticus]